MQSCTESEQYVTEVDVTSSKDSSESQEGSGVEFLPGTEGSLEPLESLEEEEDEEVVEEEEEEEGEEVMEDDTSPCRSRNWKLLRSPTHK